MSVQETMKERKSKTSGNQRTGNTEQVQEKRGRGRPHVYPKEGMSIEQLQQVEGENYDDEFESQVPSRYQYLRAKLSTTTRELAKNYVPEMYKLLKEAKIDPEGCKQKLTNDIGKYWNKSYWMRYLPEEAKDIKKVEAGRKGGQATKMEKDTNGITTEALRAVGVIHHGVEPESLEEKTTEEGKETVKVAAHERGAPETAKTARQTSTFNFEIDLRTWQPQILKEMDKAEKSGSKKLVGELSVPQGQLLWIQAGDPIEQEEKKSK